MSNTQKARRVLRRLAREFGTTAGIGACLAGIGFLSYGLVSGTLSAASASSTGEAARARPMQPAEDGELAPDRVFANCARARAAGAAPLYRGEPGYGPHLDGDGDGVACEPYPR